MSEEKEPSAKGFGLRFINAKKTQQVPPPRPDKWSPGVRVISEEEYDRFTNKLALELLATCSPEHLAVIAAQQMMYADELKHLLEENKSGQTDAIKIIETVEKIIEKSLLHAQKSSIQTGMIVLSSYRAHISKKRADGVKKNKEEVIALAQEIAEARWREDCAHKVRKGAMAKQVYDTLIEGPHRNLVSSIDSVKRWITPVTPDYASKPGR